MDTITGPNVEIDIAGARVTIPAPTITEMWLERARLKPTGAPGAMPRIGETVNGAVFMGIVRGEGGAPDYRLFDLGEAPERMNWQDAQKWAESKGGSVPTRREQSVMFGNRAEGQYREEWYWSCEQCAGHDASAWVQTFYVGTQNHDHKSNAYRARAVRREPIQ